MRLIAGLSLGLRGERSLAGPTSTRRSTAIRGRKVNHIPDAIELLEPMFAGQTIEQFRALLLGKNGDVLDMVTASGTHEGVELPVRAVFARALRCDARGLIIAHNHPSGDPSPSKADLSVTRHVATVATSLGLSVLDHLIFGHERFKSFRNDGLL